MRKKKVKCVRCEALDRNQKHPHIQYINKVPLCDVCVAEIAEEELFFKITAEEIGDESGS